MLTPTPVIEAILFGSYAKGEATLNSDIDILIDSDGVLNGLNFFRLRGELEDKLKITVDLVERLELIEKGRLQKEIEETGVVIYVKTVKNR